MPPDAMAIVWKPVHGTSPPIISYDLYVNDAKVSSQVREHNFVEYCSMQCTFICELMKFATQVVLIDSIIITHRDCMCLCVMHVQIVPDDAAERCRVVLNSCKLNEKYKIVVAALLKGNSAVVAQLFRILMPQ